jgi:ABC-type sugar transport system ATPase subunit
MHEIDRTGRRLHGVPQRPQRRHLPAGSQDDNEVVEMMIGREYSHVFPPKPPARGAADGVPRLEVRHR